MLLSLSAALAAAAKTPDLRVAVQPFNPVSGRNAVEVAWRDLNGVPATNVTLTLTASWPFVVFPPNCVPDGDNVRCSLGNVSDTAVHRLEVTLLIGGATPGSVSATIESAEGSKSGAFVNTGTHYVFVDDENSLRTAIESSGAGDTIVFPLDGDLTIRPESPLPLLHAAIDGSAHDALTGTKVALDGSELTDGDGLRTCANVTSLAITNFPGAGVRVECGHPFISSNAIERNGRGMIVLADCDIRRNVISANRASGIFVAAGIVNIDGNVIGLNATHDAPLGNGASGIYAGVDSVTIRDNFIAFNHDFGVAVASRATILPNSIFANWQMAIDVGLDGPNAGAPVVTSATYDAVNDRTEIDVPATWPVDIYAADAPHRTGRGDAQYFLGTTTSGASFFVRGDWRGKWVAARTTTSELGVAVPVD